MNDSKISRRQQDILNFIKKFSKDNGFPPSIREIGEAVKLCSPSTVHSHLRKLQQKGYIRRDSSKSRTISLGEMEERKKPKFLEFPLYALGDGDNFSINKDEEITLPLDLVGEPDAFLFKMRDDGMKDAGILKDDLVIAYPRETEPMNENEIVVVHIGGEIIVRRWVRKYNFISLEADNRLIRPISRLPKDIRILGKVMGLIRKASAVVQTPA